MNLNIKKYVPFMLVLVAVIILSGTSYALLKSTSKGSNPYVMNVGVLEISFQDSEEDKLTLVNQIPISDDEGIDSEDEYTFTIKNTGTLPATYSVYIEETSTNPEFKSVIRYITSKNNQEYGDAKTLSEDKYIDTNATLGIDQTATYKVKLWLSIDADSTYMNKTFTARIVVDTTLNYEGFDLKDPILGITLPTYEAASSDTFAGGLVAINTDGTLYDGTGTIREYRYSGPSVNNYIKFNNGEMWRIVGMFKNSSGDWNLKIMRNTMLTSVELPSTYTYNGTSLQIEDGTSGEAYWNSTLTGTNYNDWTTASLQYYLNGTDGYFGTLSSGAQALVDTNYTYYLGNYGNQVDTAISSYTSERGSTVCGSGITSNTHTNNCDIWYGNKATWNGKVALLYPSDYGYSASFSYWSSPVLWNWTTTQGNTSWMQTTANHTDKLEWMLSPSSLSFDAAPLRTQQGAVIGNFGVFVGGDGVRPVLNLLSSAPIDTNHQGNETDPYVIVIE